MNTCSKLNIYLHLNIFNKTRYQTQVQPLKIILDRITIGNIKKKAEEKKIAFMKSCRPRITIKYCTHQLIQKTIKYPLIQFRLRKKKKKKSTHFFLSCQSWVWLCGYFPLPTYRQFSFFHNQLPSIFPLLSLSSRELGVGTIATDNSKFLL